MALGSRNRDFKTSARSVDQNLKKHYKRMVELMKRGFSREQASDRAYQELFVRKGPEMKDSIEQVIDQLAEGKIKGSERDIEANTHCPRCNSLVFGDEMVEGLEVKCGHCHLDLVAVPRMIFVRKGEE